MTRAISITASFMTARYHGEEWPPSPARLFQALVAGVNTGGYRKLRPRVENALRWLEQRPAPVILARPTKRAAEYRIAVPNNDMDTVAREWAAGRPADPAKLRTIKIVSPRLIAGEEPHVRYMWTLHEDEDAQAVLNSLRPLSHCVYALGWGLDMAYAEAELRQELQDGGYEEWLPTNATGQRLPIPAPGYTEDLQEAYRRFVSRESSSGVNADTRATAYRLQPYIRRGVSQCPSRVFQLCRPDGVTTLSKGWHAAMEIAGWLRHASAEALRAEGYPGDINGFVLGHTADDSDPSFRLSFVPLPSIGHEHADGRIRRVMIVEPATADGSTVELLAGKLMGTTVTDNGGVEVCALAPLVDRKVTAFYTARAMRWRTVTPVVLHGFNSMRGNISLRKTESLLLRAFEMAGHPPTTIKTLIFQAAPLWAGTGAANSIRVPEHLRAYPRCHVEVQFSAPVAGPVLAGIGRHYGIGVFAAPGD